MNCLRLLEVPPPLIILFEHITVLGLSLGRIRNCGRFFRSTVHPSVRLLYSILKSKSDLGSSSHTIWVLGETGSHRNRLLDSKCFPSILETRRTCFNALI